MDNGTGADKSVDAQGAEIDRLTAENGKLKALLVAKDVAIAKANALADAAAAALVHAGSGNRAMGAAFLAMAESDPSGRDA